ncbi:hypothetical protein AO071_23985 [Pseudomonas syringae]|nr:hypothetical protein AO071_23985 [Pseudomonas syringae]
MRQALGASGKLCEARRHASGLTDPFASLLLKAAKWRTQSVQNGMPTQSIGTIGNENDDEQTGYFQRLYRPLQDQVSDV